MLNELNVLTHSVGSKPMTFSAIAVNDIRPFQPQASIRPYRTNRRPLPGANPTIASYNASVVKTYRTVNSMARF
jgi:hypothetical protein